MALPFVPDLTVREVVVAGAARVDPAQVRLAAALEGEPLFTASGADAAARVRTLPGVRAARVSLQLPDRAFVQIEERVPLVVIAFRGGWLYADGTGALFEGDDPDREPTLEDETRTYVAGERVDPALVGAARRLWTAAAGGALGADVRRVRLTETHGLVATLDRGTEIRIGGVAELDRKLAVARRIVQERAGRPLDYVDVRSPDIVIYFPVD